MGDYIAWGYGLLCIGGVYAAVRLFQIGAGNRIPGLDFIPCQRCAGAGTITNADDSTGECPRCAGTGER